MSATDDQLRAAAVAVLGRPPCQDAVCGWLRTLAAHLGETGLSCSEPSVTNLTERLSDGVFTSAQASLVDASSGHEFMVQAVLYADCSQPGFGTTTGALEAYFIEKDADGQAVNFISYVRQQLFSTVAMEPGTTFVNDEQGLTDLLSTRLSQAMREAFDMGVGPHLHRFRLALEDVLAP